MPEEQNLQSILLDVVTCEITVAEAEPLVRAAVMRESGTRAQLAGQAMQGLLASGDVQVELLGVDEGRAQMHAVLPGFCVGLADAMLAELAKKGGR